MEKIFATALVMLVVFMLGSGIFHLGVQTHEAECIERAKIMDQYNETTKIIICGTEDCKTK